MMQPKKPLTKRKAIIESHPNGASPSSLNDERTARVEAKPKIHPQSSPFDPQAIVDATPIQGPPGNNEETSVLAKPRDGASPPSKGGKRGANSAAETTDGTPSLSPQEIHWSRLRTQAEIYADLQEMRKAIGNRLFQTKKRGIFDPVLDQTIQQLKDMEAVVGKEMETCLADALPQVVAWVETQPGVGLLSLARLLAQTGHPVHTVPHHWEGKGGKRKLVTDAPMERTVGQLWQYCGVGGPSKKKRGELGFWNPQAKMCAYLVATNCMKQKGKDGYRAVYDARRLRTADKKHSEPCVRCGPSGKPAQVGSEWSDGHAMADALRIVSKELLRDLWVLCNTQDDEARQLAKPNSGPSRRLDSHDPATMASTKPSIRSSRGHAAAGRHKRNCGLAFPCPTGKHPT